MRPITFLVTMALALSGGTPTVADLLPSTAMTIPISRRGLGLGALLKEGTDLIDTGKVKAHLQHLKQKYSRLTNKHVKRSGTGTVPLTDEQEGLYWSGPMKVGTPYQEILVDFDTGSSDLIAPGNRPGFDPSASSTAKDTGDSFSITYGDGTTANGTVYTDSILIGGLAAKNVTIGRASPNFDQDLGSNAIGGMGLPQLSSFPQQTPFWKALADQGVISPVFSFHLAQEGSKLVLGAGGPSPTYVEVSSAYDSPGFWLVNGTLAGAKMLMLVDTGTSALLVPPTVAKQIFAKLKLTPVTEAGDDTIYGKFPCNSPPPVNFEFGGKTFNLAPDAQSLGKWTDGECVSSIFGSDLTGTDDVMIAGDPLFESAIVTFDFTAAPRVGFS